MKEAVQEILERYLGQGKPSGDYLSFRCPFHKGGEERRPSFGVNLTTGVANCFVCCESWGLPTLLRLLEVPSHVIDAELQEIREDLQEQAEKKRWAREHRCIVQDPFSADVTLPEKLLLPYRQKLPDKLLNLGFREDWLNYFEVGTDPTHYRIIYPVRDLHGHLVGCVGGAMFREQIPKYLVYQGRRKQPDGSWRPSEYGPGFDRRFPRYRFENHKFLWNFDRVYPILRYAPTGRFLTVVEGFKAAMWTAQSGLHDVVATMGAAVSEMQAEQLRKVSVPTVWFLDNNEAGIRAALKYGSKFYFERGEHYVAKYPDVREQPDDLAPEEVQRAVLEPEHFLAFLKRHESLWRELNAVRRS